MRPSAFPQRYRTLRVTLGEGAGKNWWCVVFPSLCLPAASGEEALLSLPEEQRRLVEDSQQCQVKLKAVELWEALREWLRADGAFSRQGDVV